MEKQETSVSIRSSESSGDSRTPCSTHGNPTPKLDRQLQQPEAKEMLQALIASLNNIADEKQCTTCAVEQASQVMTGYLREIKAAKREGRWSKEERKALKKEVKGLAKGVKRKVKALWREETV